MKQTESLGCNNCGGSLTLPEDPAAVSMVCPYCGDTFIIPEAVQQRREARRRDAVKAAQAAERSRAEQAQADKERKSRNLSLWLRFGSVAAVLGVSLGMFFMIRAQIPDMPPPSPRSPAASTPSAPPPPTYPTDPVSVGATATAERMKALYDKGCKSIVHPAKQAVGDIAWSPEFPKSKRADCLYVLAMTGNPENRLTLSLTTPFGEPVPVPEPGTNIEFLHCADTGGPHPLTVSASNGAPYTFAAVGCPRRIANKMRKGAEASAPNAPEKNKTKSN